MLWRNRGIRAGWKNVGTWQTKCVRALPLPQNHENIFKEMILQCWVCFGLPMPILVKLLCVISAAHFPKCIKNIVKVPGSGKERVLCHCPKM